VSLQNRYTSPLQRPPPLLSLIWSTTQARSTYGGLCGMPAWADTPWDVVSCDTPPELWRGAAGPCVRVHARTCAGAAESLHTYIHTYTIYDVCTMLLRSTLAFILIHVLTSNKSSSGGGIFTTHIRVD